MTDKENKQKPEELNDSELGNVQGGASKKPASGFFPPEEYRAKLKAEASKKEGSSFYEPGDLNN